MNQSVKAGIAGVIAAGVIFWAGFYIGQNSVTNLTANKTIKLGFIGPLSGDAAALGENMKVAVEIARDEVNAAGGVNGRKIEVIFEDGKCDGKDAVNAGNKLLNVDGVTAIIGGVCSAETLAVAPLAEKAETPLISAASTNPKITDAGKYVFRFVPSDSFQGSYTAEHFVNGLKKKRIAIMYCKSDYCTGIKDAFKTHLKELGGTVSAEEGFEKDARDLRAQITKVKTSNPDIVYFVSYTEGTIVGLKQMKELGVTTKVFGADAWDDPKIGQELKKIADSAQYSLPANQNLPAQFVDEMKKRTQGKELVVYAPRAYDAIKSLAMIMEKAGDDKEKITAALANLKDSKGIADTYTMDANGDIGGAKYIIKEFKDGKAEEVK